MEQEIGILETNAAYKAAMKIIKESQYAAHSDHDEFVSMAMYHAGEHLTDSQRELVDRLQEAGAR